MFRIILNILFPKRCVGCSRVGYYICRACAGGVCVPEAMCPKCMKPAIDGKTHPYCRTPYGLDGLTCLFVYRGVVRQAITKIKYRWIYDVGEALVNLTKTSTRNGVALVPVPLHPRRKKWRGFNQSELLGRIFAKKVGLTVATNILVRKINTKPQTAFRKTKRIANIHGAFALSSKIQKLPTQVILFDDVWTTGSTMRECAKVLKRNGVEWVWGVTIAR